MTLRNAAMLTARKKLGLAQIACADAAGVSVYVLRELERMDYSEFSGDNPKALRRRGIANALALFLQIPLEDVLPVALIGARIHSLAVREADVDAGQLLCAGRSTQDLALPASDAAERNEAAELLRKAVGELPGLRAGPALTLRYGLDGQGERSFEEVGNALGVTRERARQVVVKAERDLHNQLGPQR